MNLVEKDRFVNDILEDLRQQMKKKIDQFPEEWDGHEIRKFIGEYYHAHYVFDSGIEGKRLKDYKNHLIVSNLI